MLFLAEEESSGILVDSKPEAVEQLEKMDEQDKEIHLQKVEIMIMINQRSIRKRRR